MRNKLNKFTENLIRLAALERVHQLEEMDGSTNVVERQLLLGELADEIILRANKAPQGLIEVVFTKKQANKNTPVEKILLNSVSKISGFNVRDPESVNSLFRTVIVVDPKWSSNVSVYQCEYGLPNSFLKL